MSDAEFQEVRGQLVQENLMDPESGRGRRRVRWPDGRETDKEFLHLWTSREEAEAFASRLRGDGDDPRWKVFEVDVEGTIDEILDPRRLPIPPSPKGLSIRHGSYVDSLGEDALRILVTIEDKPSGGYYDWSEVSETYQAIHDALTDEGIELHPYVQFLTASEEAEQPQDA